jgi:hypothetical protein
VEQVAFPILVGRPHPLGHPEYPRMGSYFNIQGGGGTFPTDPSPATNNAAVAFLRNKAPGAISEAGLMAAEAAGVAEVVHGLTAVQGCKLWDCAPAMTELELSREQVPQIPLFSEYNLMSLYQ